MRIMDYYKRIRAQNTWRTAHTHTHTLTGKSSGENSRSIYGNIRTWLETVSDAENHVDRGAVGFSN